MKVRDNFSQNSLKNNSSKINCSTNSQVVKEYKGLSLIDDLMKINGSQALMGWSCTGLMIL